MSPLPANPAIALSPQISPFLILNPVLSVDVALPVPTIRSAIRLLATDATPPLFLDGPPALYLSNNNFSCPDKTAINIGGGMPPYSLLLLNATAALLNGTNLTAHTFSEYVLRKIDGLGAGNSSIGTVGSLGENVQFAVLDTINTFAISPLVNVTAGISGVCSPLENTKNKIPLAFIIPFSIAGAIILLTFLSNCCCGIVGACVECCADINYYCCELCCSCGDSDSSPPSSILIGPDPTRFGGTAEENEQVHDVQVAPTKMMGVEALARKMGVDRAPDPQ